MPHLIRYYVLESLNGKNRISVTKRRSRVVCRLPFSCLLAVFAPHVLGLLAQTAEESYGFGAIALEQALDSTFDFALASDVFLSEGSLAYRAQHERFEWGLSLSHSNMDLDYKPNPVADLIGTDKTVTTDRLGAQLFLILPVDKRHRGRIGGGFYDGYTNYRTLWLDEYYRQQFSRLAGYQDADPFGLNGSMAWRWEYLPATGIADLSLSYQQDTISPGYDRPLFQALERGRELLKTGGINLSIEQVLSSRHRARIQFSLTDTTNRSIRQSAQASLNYSLADHWVLRTAIARTSEQTGFRSHSLEGSLEHDWQNNWFVGIGMRHYEDNGDIENSLFVVSTAAPDLQTDQYFLSLRWTNQQSALRLEAGPYEIDYEAPDSIVAPFAFLYSKRNFFRIGISYSYRF